MACCGRSPSSSRNRPGVHHAAYAYIRVSGPAKPLPSLEALLYNEHDKLMTQLAEHFGGEEFAREVKSERMKQIIMEYVKLEIEEIEETRRNIDQYLESQSNQLS